MSEKESIDSELSRLLDDDNETQEDYTKMSGRGAPTSPEKSEKLCHTSTGSDVNVGISEVLLIWHLLM